MATLQGKGAITSLADVDHITIHDASSTTEDAAGDLKKITWANFKTAIKTYYNSVTATLTNKTINGGTFDSVYLPERADHVNTPAAGSAELWVKNSATQELMVTDDAGTDRTVLTDQSGATLTDTQIATGDSLPFFDLSDSDNAKQDTVADLITLITANQAHNVNAQTGTTYTLVIGDQGGVVTMSNASANTLTIPTNASVAFPTGSIVTIFMIGAGTTTVAGDTGVTLSGAGGSASAGSCDIQTQYGSCTIIKTGTNAWLVAGDIDAVA